MLSEILDDTMTKAMKIENITRSTKFAYANKTIKNSNKLDENELLMLQKISKYVKPELKTPVEEEIEEYIVEKPEQKVQVFDFENREKTGLPFFRSIEAKLGKSV